MLEELNPPGECVHRDTAVACCILAKRELRRNPDSHSTLLSKLPSTQLRSSDQRGLMHSVQSMLVDCCPYSQMQLPQVACCNPNPPKFLHSLIPTSISKSGDQSDCCQRQVGTPYQCLNLPLIPSNQRGVMNSWFPPLHFFLYSSSRVRY